MSERSDRVRSEIVTLPPRRGGTTQYARYAVRTPLIGDGDDIVTVISECVEGFVQDGDIVFVSEKAVATSQGRAIRVDQIQPRWLARVLSTFVHKVPYGIGLGIPETMEMAIREVGAGRILLAAAVGLLGRLVGRQGDFYRVAGQQVASIDGPTPYTLPPLNRCVVMGPLDAPGVAQRISSRIGAHVAIVDVNDLGGTILGHTPSLDEVSVLEALSDNPLGQGAARTPVGILRPVPAARPEGAPNAR